MRMLGGDAAGVPSSHQRLYMERPAGGGNGWNHFDVGFVDNGGVPAARTRSYTIGSSLDPAIDALKAAVEQAAPFIASRNPFTSSSATTNPSIATNSSSVPQFDRRYPPHYNNPDPPPPPEEEYDFSGYGGGGNRLGAQPPMPLLLSLVSNYRSLLRDYVVDIETAAAGPSSSSTTSDFRTPAAKRDIGQEADGGIDRDVLYTRVARCCASWLESLSHQAFSQPSLADGGRSQIDKLAASIPPVLAEEAISSLLKTAILQSLLLTRIANEKSRQRNLSKGSFAYASAASLMPPPANQHLSLPQVNSFTTNEALLQALRESPSDSTITGLLKEVDLQRIAAKFSSYTNSSPSFPADVGSLIRSTGTGAVDDALMMDTSRLGGGGRSGLLAESRHRSYSDFQQHDAMPRSTTDVKMMIQTSVAGSAPSKRTQGGGDVVVDEEYPVEGSPDAVSGTRKKRGAQQRSSSPSSSAAVASSDVPLSTGEGVHVPQLDLDAILMPSSAGPSANGQSLSSSAAGGGGGDVSEWQQRVRQAVRKGTASLLTNNSRQHRVRSHSDLGSKVSDHLENQMISEDLDLRPTWMRKPKLFKAIKSKIEVMVQQKPVFYVEWNILGFLKVLNDPSQDRIVSPEYAISIGSNIELPPLRLMVSIYHGDQEQQPGISANNEHCRCTRGNVKIGVEFTIPADIEVKYHVFHGSFFSEARWHSFKDKPWAGVNAQEVSEYLPHPIDQNLTVGVILLEIKGKGLTSSAPPPSQVKLPAKTARTQPDINESEAGRQDRDGVSSVHDNQSTLSGSPRRLLHSSSSSRQVSWAQAAGLSSMLQKGSGASLNGSGYASSASGRPRAYSDWHGGGHANSTMVTPQLRSHLTPPSTMRGPMALPSVSDLLRLSGAPEALLAHAHGTADICSGSVTNAPTETPSLMLHESLSRMSLNPSDQFDKQLFTEIWSSSAPATYDDLVFGCLR